MILFQSLYIHTDFRKWLRAYHFFWHRGERYDIVQTPQFSDLLSAPDSFGEVFLSLDFILLFDTTMTTNNTPNESNNAFLCPYN
ncbi:MAG: hypothetical protein WCJ81_00425 [bacterium]